MPATLTPKELVSSVYRSFAAGAIDSVMTSAHVARFSGGSATAQKLPVRHPELVGSLVLVSRWGRPDAYFVTMGDSWRWMADVAPSERAMLEALFLWIYTRRAHEEGTVGQIIEETLAFPHPQPPEAFQRQLAAWMAHDTMDRLSEITAPTLVVAGERDIACPRASAGSWPSIARDAGAFRAFHLVAGLGTVVASVGIVLLGRWLRSRRPSRLVDAAVSAALVGTVAWIVEIAISDDRRHRPGTGGGEGHRLADGGAFGWERAPLRHLSEHLGAAGRPAAAVHAGQPGSAPDQACHP